MSPMRLKATVFFLFFALIIFYRTSETNHLLVVEVDGKEIMKFEVKENEVFIFEYVNSVDGNLVRDVFEVKNGNIVLLKEEYPWYGVGQEFTKLRYEGGMVVVDVNRKMNEFVFRGAFTVPQKLVIKEKDYSVAFPGKKVVLRVR